MKRGVKNEHTGVTEAKLLSLIRSSLRKVSSQTARSAHIKAVRYHKINPASGRPKWHVQCVLCKREMQCGEKIYRTKKDGTRYKKPSKAFDVDHINGNPPLTCIAELSAYAESLFYGALRVLCWECHRDHGKK